MAGADRRRGSARATSPPPIETIAALRRAAAALGRLSDRALLGGIAGALALWPGPRGLARRAASDLAARSGRSEAMLRFGLERAVAAHRPAALARWLRQGGGSRGPAVVAEILAGNVAGLALSAIVEALLARSAVLVKPAADEPVTAPLFLASLRRAAPVLADAVAVLSWEGGDEAIESPVFSSVGAVIVSGGEAGTRSVSERSKAPVLVHGPRYAIGLVGGGWRSAGSAWFEKAAREIALWDQAGCLSPRVLLVEGDIRRFAGKMAGAMAAWERRWPAAPRPEGRAASVHAARAAWDMAPGRGGLFVPEGTAWTVAWGEAMDLDPGPAARWVRIAPMPRPREAERLLREHAGRLQAVGLSRLGDSAPRWRETIRKAGIPWAASLLAIQDPPAGWRADGFSGLVQLVALGERERKEAGGSL